MRHERTCHVTQHRSAPGPGDPRTWTCGPLATADQAGRGRGRSRAATGRPATGCGAVQCSRWWPLTGRLPSTTARPTGRQADERSPETLSEQVNQQQLPHPAHFATRTHTKVQGARRAQSGTVFSFQIQTPAKSRQVNLVMLALLSWSMLVAGS